MAGRCPFLADLDAQERLTDARYDDATGEAVFSSGADPVQVSITVFDQDGDMPNSAGLSTLFTTFGQFLDHDLALSPEDHDAGTLNLIGMPHDIARSEIAPDTGEDGPRAPTNVVTWELDGSQVYGSTEGRETDLREFEGGRLKVQEDVTSASTMLPDATPDTFMAGDITGDDPVYLAGDVRANENPNLLSLHTVFAREHNYWADRLSEEHPDWDDQQLFEAARAIVEVELQQITYNEWLPHLIGDAVGPDTGFDASISGQMSVEFSTAAFRFGHTLVSSSIDRIDESGEDAGSMGLMDSFFNHSPVEDGGLESILRGQLSATAQELDAQIVDDLNFFLETPDGVSGFSLAALNLARSLDHGLQSYIDTRAALIGDIDPATIDPQDFSLITSDADTQARLAAIYEDVHQVDLWVGGLAEDALPGMQLGPLFTHIVSDQFTRTRAADDSFGDLPDGLSPEMIEDILGGSFADIIARTTDVDMVQEDVFLAADRTLSEIDGIETTWRADIIELAAKILNGPLYTGTGDDVVTLSGGALIDGDISMVQGHDTLVMTSGLINGDIRTGRGDDTVELTGTADVAGNVDTNSGEDRVTMGDMAHVQGNVLTGHNDDTVNLSGRAIIEGELCTGHGEDDVTLGARTTVGGTVNSGRGDDIIRLEVGADLGGIHGGKGFDTLAIQGPHRIEYDAINPTKGTVVYLDETGEETGETVDFRSIEMITCFTLGTLIITERGKLPIDSLKVGDRVLTLDAGLQPVRWIGRTRVPAQGTLAPIAIAAGAMGNGRELRVSPQHRMLLDGWRVEVYCGAEEVLAPAKALTNDTSIRRVEGGTVTYIHIAFDTHQIVFAEGIPSESFHAGAVALTALEAATKAELLALFPELARTSGGPITARPVVTAQEARLLL